jgi:hypothetical protein
MTFCTFTQHFFAEKCTLPLPDNNFENSFSVSLLLHLPFNKPKPITYSNGIKRPCPPFWEKASNFYEGRQDGSRALMVIIYVFTTF